jgi:hypothetical protein
VKVRCPIQEESEFNYDAERRRTSTESVGVVKLDTSTDFMRLKMIFYKEMRVNQLSLAFNYAFTQHENLAEE